MAKAMMFVNMLCGQMSYDRPGLSMLFAISQSNVAGRGMDEAWRPALARRIARWAGAMSTPTLETLACGYQAEYAWMPARYAPGGLPV
jgi:hypothetical protein